MLPYHTNQKGVMLITALFLITVLTGISAIFLFRSISEARAVEREVDRVRAYCAAEAGFQGVLSQIGSNSYTGFVNTAPYSTTLFLNGKQSALCTATPSTESSDYIIINATGSGVFSVRSLEARVFLDSNLSKYLVYSNSTSFSSGTGAQYGEPLVDEATGNVITDGTGRARVAQDPFDRAMMYFTGDWVISGTNVEMYGDVYVQDDMIVNSGQKADIFGDTFVTDQYQNSGTLIINDTYNDGVDKRKMTTDMNDTLMPINLTFYAAHNNIPSFGATTQNRYLEFCVSADGTHTVVKEYNNRAYSTLINSYDLPATGIVYVKGDAFIKGTIKGRVSVVASDDIFIQGSLLYANGLGHADASDSAAYLARNKLYFCGNNISTYGIYYAERAVSSDPAFDATYDVTGASNPSAKVHLTMKGNRIIKGTTNLSYYDTRDYLYDPYLKKFRPPGLPITSVVSFVREI